MDRIAIFQYEWPLLSYTSNLALKLAESGYLVDYFQKDCTLDFFELETFNENKNISVFNLSLSKVQKWKERMIRRTCEVRSQNPEDDIISKQVFTKSLDIIKKNDYKCFIGIEKKGLIWAGKISEIVRVPYLYFSTELYVEDHPGFKHAKDFYNLRQQEKKYHGLSKATIIQDEMRAEVLLMANEISQTDLIYIPISILGDINEKSSDYFHDKFNIGKNKKVIFCLGQITKNRLSFELAEIAQYLDDEYVMVLHGPGERKEVEALKKKYSSKKLIISDKLVPSWMLRQLTASAYIGLVIYKNECSNDRLTAFSSEKIAYYMQSGIPIIAFDIGNYRNLMNIYHCGELIGDIKELPSAVDKITKNYSYYSQNAYMAYNEKYNFEKHYHKLQAYIEHLD